MFNSNGGYSLADIAAVTDNNGRNSGAFGNDWAWIIILLLCGWGNGGFGNGGFGGGSNGATFPLWAYTNNTDNLITNGFDNAAINGALAGIQSSITTGFSGAEVAACNRAIDSLQTAYNNQIASMNQSFANAQDLANNLNAISSGLQNCCCENRAAVADLKYTVATEACADRAAIENALRDVLTANTASTQRILDQMCQDKIDAKNEKIADLERQLSMANFAASQVAQTAQIRAGQVEEIDAMYNRLKNCPVPSMPVYGTQPIFTCNGGCGCGNTLATF